MDLFSSLPYSFKLNPFCFRSVLQVVYPALDLKVKNVTRAYTVEHEDEVRLKIILKLRSSAISSFLFIFLLSNPF